VHLVRERPWAWQELVGGGGTSPKSAPGLWW
jgi:hypothetical protein